MQVIYIGNNQAKQLPEMTAPRVIDYPDPAWFEMDVEIFKEHLNTLHTFYVAPDLAIQMEVGKVYDETFFKIKKILTNP